MPDAFKLPDFPATLSLDTKSRHTLMGATQGNCFCAIMSLPQGVIYVAPYTQKADRPKWSGADNPTLTEYASFGASCAGAVIPNFMRMTLPEFFHLTMGRAGGLGMGVLKDAPMSGAAPPKPP